MDWATHDHRPPSQASAPPPEPIVVCWTVIGPSDQSKPITCAIYAAAAGRFEVRLGYRYDDPMRTQLALHRAAAEDIAAIWKTAALAKGFTEVALTAAPTTSVD